MKPKYLFTSMLALATIVVTSCSAPRIAQQSNSADDVYGSTAQAKEYTPLAPVQQQAYQDTYDENDDYYGTSDPYYDMDYSSRINRFYNGSSWRSYYDPYFDNGFYGYNGFGYNGFSLGLGFGSIWNSPYYGWGSFYSPFSNLYSPWGWGYNNFYGGGFYGGGFYGGGYYGGGYYGGGTYTGRTTNVPRPSMGRENTPRSNFGIGGSNGVRGSRGSSTRTDANGNVVTRRTRAEIYNTDGNGTRPANGQSTRGTRPTGEASRPAPQNRPTRESYRPEPQSRPTYSPPPSSRGESGGGRSSSGSGSSGRSSRGGRG
ncbi:hypothetical protein PBAL39_19225 [Pedobacter sp. BAL39]|uniref:hypothetical protein n=1 Tax=Pedobacter sp. BAL39 TaxID=391596 RepID=UPI000155AC56|nr:hypothetical protein [Pedobacter sp. BAL39]EDM34454.1 hypothetical protein PBAL39_19225 [Pedobacter sp. BAL39]